jgi:Amt family ammonium transporter
MKNLLKKFSLIGLLSLFLMGFLNVGVAETTDIFSGQSLLVAEADAAPVADEAAPAEEEPATLDTGDTAWMIVATILVIVMAIPGLALFYGGLVRSKNMLSVLMQVFVIFSLMSVLWVLFGYSLAFKDGGSLNTYIGGLGSALLKGITADTLSGTIPEYVFITFQLTFAALTPALIVGAFAERIKFSALLVFMPLWLLTVYIPICHMVWGGGMMSEWGTIDFAGGTVVHINAGIAALIGAILVGKRTGLGKVAMAPHNLPATMIGASLLWAGWFGFNVGSELAADGTAGLVMINTQVATAAAVLGWIFIEWITKGKPSMLGGASGAVAGLVAITPACAVLGPAGSIILGLVASIVSFWACTSLKNALGYDDSLDVFGVHGVAGIVGAIGLAILMSPDFGGVGYDEGVTMMSQLTVQAKSVLFTIVWCGVISFILYKVVDAIIGLRVSAEDEITGLDTTSHGETAYRN